MKAPKYIINSNLLVLNPEQLNLMVKEIADKIKSLIKVIKKYPLTKKQKKLNAEYENELYWKDITYIDDNITLSMERQMREDYLELLYNISKNESGKGTEFRIVELKEMYAILKTTEVDFSSYNDYNTKQILIILSNYN
jgi:hypothetical protein